MTEHSLAPEVLVFSKKVWDTLRKEDQAMIRKAAKESVPVMRKLWDEREEKSRKTVEAAGVQIVPIANKEEFVDAMKPVYDKFAGDAEAARTSSSASRTRSNASGPASPRGSAALAGDAMTRPARRSYQHQDRGRRRLALTRFNATVARSACTVGDSACS